MDHWRLNARRTACALGLMALLAATVSCDESEPKPPLSGAPRVNVGYKEDQPGTSYEDESTNAFDGFEVELGLHIAKNLDTEFTEIDVTSKERVEALKRDVDLLLATFSYNEERNEEVDFAGIYMKTQQALLVQGGDYTYDGLDSPADFEGMKVCTLEDSTSFDMLEDDVSYVLSKAEIVSKRKLKDCVKLLEEGKVQGISTDETILYGLAKEKEFRVVPELVFGPTQYYGVGIKKGRRADCKAVQEIVEDYTESNAWEENFKLKLPLADEFGGGFRNFRPTRKDSASLSCRDTPGP